MTQQNGEFSGDFSDGWYIVSTADDSSHMATAVRAGMLVPFRSFSTEAEARAFIDGFKNAMVEANRPNLGDGGDRKRMAS